MQQPLVTLDLLGVSPGSTTDAHMDDHQGVIRLRGQLNCQSLHIPDVDIQQETSIL